MNYAFENLKITADIKTKFYGKYGISAIISDFADNPTLMKYS